MRHELPRAVEQRFRFVPGAPLRREDAARRFADDLVAVLVEAAALDLPVRVRWESGRDAAPQLTADAPACQRWVHGALTAIYGGARWAPDPSAAPGGSATLARVGRIDPALGLPPLDPEGATPWSESARRALRSLPRGVAVVWQLAPGPGRRPSQPAPPPVEPVRLPTGARLSGLTASERELRDRIDARRRDVAWVSSVRLEIDDESARRLVAPAMTLVARSSALRSGGPLRWNRAFPWRWTDPPRFGLSTAEVAGLFPTPWSFGDPSAGLPLDGSSLILGRTELGRVLRVPVPLGEGRHLAILGQTGMGKSTALVRLSLQALREGTLVLFDPIGDTARALLDRLPSVAVERSRWVDAARGATTFNALAPSAGVRRSAAQRAKSRGDLVDALRRVRLFRYADTPFWGPRLEEMLGRALAAAASYPRGTLVEAERLLAGVGRRSIGGVPEEARPFVEELDALARARPEEVDGARRLLAEITGHEVLRRLLCDPTPTCDPEQLIAPGGIVVISGEAPAIGEGPARHFLGVVLALIWTELLARPSGPKTFLALDEAQWYAHDAVGEILRLGRRTNAHLWLATQSLAALEEPVREAVLTNVADFVVFRGSPDDAREFARWSGQAGAESFLSLGRGEAMALVGARRIPERVRFSPLPAGERTGAQRQLIAERSGPEAVAPAAPAAAGTGVSVGELLLAAEATAPPGPTFDFPFARVRAALDPAGGEVRALGAELRRAGALSHRRADPTGDVWAIDRAALAEWRARSGRPEASGRARDAWKRLATADSEPG